MSREEFMKKLEALLFDISSAERQNALDYYEDYFSDAGPENEAQVICELGSPERVARSIKEGIYGRDSEGVYTEQGYRADARTGGSMPTGTGYGQNAPQGYAGNSQNGQTGQQGYAGSGQNAWQSGQAGQQGYAGNSQNTWQNGQAGQQGYTGSGQNTWQNAQYTQPAGDGKPPKKGWDASRILLVIILGILCIPVAATLFGVAVGILGTIFGLAVAVVALAFVGWIVGVILLVCSLFLVFSPGSALVTAGVGCIFLVAGALFTLLIVWMIVKVIPAVVRAFVSMFKRLFSRGGQQA